MNSDLDPARGIIYAVLAGATLTAIAIIWASLVYFGA